eukprot:g7607.t1
MKSSRVDRYNLEELGATNVEQNLGLVTKTGSQMNSRDSSRKSDPLAKYKEARLKHRVQVEEDRDLLTELNSVFRRHKDTLSFQKSEGEPMDPKDEQFNSYLALFSVPNTVEEQCLLLRKSLQNEEISDLEEIIENDDSLSDLRNKAIAYLKEVVENKDSSAALQNEETSRLEEIVANDDSLPELQNEVISYPEEIVENDDSLSDLQNEEMSDVDEIVENDDTLPELQNEQTSDIEEIVKNEDSSVVLQNEAMSDLEEIVENDDSLPELQIRISSILTQFSPREQIQYLTDLEEQANKFDAPEKTKKQQEFVEILVGALRDQVPLQLPVLDLLTRQLSTLASQHSIHVLPLFVQELKRMQNLSFSDWQLPNDLLLMRLVQEIFRDQSIDQCLTGMYCQYLMEGKLDTRRDQVSALFVCSSLTAILGRKFCPEILLFYKKLLQQLLTSPIECNGYQEDSITGLKLTDFSNQDFECDNVELYVLWTALKGIEKLFYGLLECLQSIKQTHQALPESLISLLCTLMTNLEDCIVNRASTRSPMKHSKETEKGIQQRQPVFEEKMDFEETKKWKMESLQDRRNLKRKLNKERRGAIKELRKDGEYLAQVRTEEKHRVDEQRERNEKAFYKELRRFDDDMRQGGQAGMNPHLKRSGTRLWKY